MDDDVAQEGGYVFVAIGTIIYGAKVSRTQSHVRTRTHTKIYPQITHIRVYEYPRGVGGCVGIYTPRLRAYRCGGTGVCILMRARVQTTNIDLHANTASHRIRCKLARNLHVYTRVRKLH